MKARDPYLSPTSPAAHRARQADGTRSGSRSGGAGERRRIAVHFSILGPLEVRHRGELLALDGRAEQAVLALLLLGCGQVVPFGPLADAARVTRSASPALGSSRDAVERHVDVLRARLCEIDPMRRVVLARPHGYALSISDAELDARALERRLGEAGHAAALERWSEAAERLRSALALWRGPTLAGLPGRAIRTAAESLDRRRLDIYADCFGIEARLAPGRAVLDELEALATRNPTHEGLAGQLMQALHRTGHDQTAADVYRRTREALRDECHREPGAQLRSLYRTVRAADSVAAALRSPGAQKTIGASVARLDRPPAYTGRSRPAATPATWITTRPTRTAA